MGCFWTAPWEPLHQFLNILLMELHIWCYKTTACIAQLEHVLQQCVWQTPDVDEPWYQQYADSSSKVGLVIHILESSMYKTEW